ncbi:MAG: gamma-glutamyltransferase family protein [Gemmatimonadaceae bacterium]|nr:gamma-glutamyltransferase family protein [Gemmatimonadaceae bacterium]
MPLRRSWVLVLAALAACARPSTPPATLAPDIGKRLVAANGVVASAHPLASEAGLTVLREGGNAVDAAVATAFAIGVVEPEMSGVGGGGAMLVWRQHEHRADFLDFYASQPIASFRAAHAVGRDSTAPLRVVGVPGNVAGLLLAQERFGRLTRAQVLAPAIRLAEEGFAMYPVLAGMIARDTARLRRDSVARALFLPTGRPLGLGEHFANPALARVLRAIAAQGRAGFYEGPIARDVVTRMNRGGHPVRLEDFARYEPTWRRPLCTTYNGRVVLSAPPPEGGLQVLETVKLLDPRRAVAAGLPTQSARAFDLFTSALRVGEAANRGNGDPRWIPVPARGLISDGFVAARAPEIGTGHAADSVAPRDARAFDAAPSPSACAPFDPYGAAPAVAAEAQADRTPSGGETTHISVVDRDGNAVAVTVTNSSVFGSGAAVDGFFLNNSGATVTQAELDRPNAPAWLTRFTTIAPTLALRDGRVELVIGSPGGGRIPLAIAQTIWYVLDYGLDPLAAVRMPRISPNARTPVVELDDGFDPAVLAAARGMGYVPTPPGFEYARIYMIVRRGNAWIGVADPRHDGQVRGY